MFTGLISFFVGNWTRLAIYGLVAVVLLGWAGGIGYMHGVAKLYEYQADQMRETVKVIIKRGEVTTRILTKYITVKAQAEVVTNTIEKEVVRYEKDNAGSCLDARWGVLHDSAAAGTIPPATAGLDGTGAAPQAAIAIQAVTENYATCRRALTKLAALQDWLHDQAAIKP